MKSDSKVNEEKIKEPTEEEIIIIEFFERLFEKYRRVHTIEECDFSISPDSMLELLEEFYPDTGFTKGHLVKLLLQNEFKYTTMAGINIIWLIAYK